MKGWQSYDDAESTDYGLTKDGPTTFWVTRWRRDGLWYVYNGYEAAGNDYWHDNHPDLFQGPYGKNEAFAIAAALNLLEV